MVLLIPIFVQFGHTLWAAVLRLVMIVLMKVMTAFVFLTFILVALFNIRERKFYFNVIFLLHDKFVTLLNLQIKIKNILYEMEPIINTAYLKESVHCKKKKEKINFLLVVDSQIL